MISTELLEHDRQRLVVVCDPGELANQLRARYPRYEVQTAPTYLAGIALLAVGPARGVLVGVDPEMRKLDKAISALRKAAGTTSRLVLCCDPGGEPAARNVVQAGADDYLIYPPRGDELDEALAIMTVADSLATPTPESALPNWQEINAMAGLLANLGEGPQALLDRLCQLLADSMRTPFVRIVAGDYSATVGDIDSEPALVEAFRLREETEATGRIFIGTRHRSPYSLQEVEKLRHYGNLVAHLLEACRERDDLQRMAMTDAATQLPNRRFLMQALESILARARANQFCVTVLIFDLDGFKHFNDTYGHAAGDEILRETGQLFRRTCRRHDIVARYAGDEFVVVFWDAERPRVPGSKHPRSTLQVINRFQKALRTHNFERLGAENVGHITVSGGLASYPWDARSAEELIHSADKALLQAKSSGKNCFYLVGSDPEQPPEKLTMDDPIDPASETA